MRKTRTQIVWGYLRRLEHETNASWPTIATGIRECHEKLVPAELRLTHFSEHKDVYKRARLDAQTLRRDIEEDERTHRQADLEDAMVLYMPEPYRSDCEAELAAMRGRLSTPIPQEGGEVATLGALTEQIGEMFVALGPALLDGKIGPEDAPLAKSILKEITDVESILIGMRKQVNAILPEFE